MMATEKRLIYLDEAIAKVQDDGILGAGYSDDERMDDVIDMLESCHTVDAVEVIRCKGCKYCDPENLHCDHPMGTTFPFPRKLNDFCSYGERKDNG